MISNLFHAAFYNPIYNILVALLAWLPGESVGLAVITLTILIRLILLPFTLAAARTQRAMRALEPKLKELKELHKGDKEKEALATLELYKSERVNPFASLLTLFVQVPVLLALYWVFRYEPFTTLDLARLYAFTPHPAAVSLSFLGVSITGKSIVLAALAGLAQYAQAALALSGQAPAGSGTAQDFQRVLGTQMKYVFPLLIAVICYTTSAAVALYFLTTNVIGALQELYVRRKYKSQSAS
jgi:YidC/Oxa1 family membrane protein insertase